MGVKAGHITDEGMEELVRRLRLELLAVSLGDDALMTEEEAAHLLDVHPKTLYRLRSSGELQAGFIGNSPRYSLGQIRRFSRELMKSVR